MAANLMHGDPRNLRQRASLLASLYDQHAPLNSQELAALPLFIQAAVAMEYLGALYERVFNDNSSSETTYLLELGEAGVRMID